METLDGFYGFCSQESPGSVQRGFQKQNGCAGEQEGSPSLETPRSGPNIHSLGFKLSTFHLLSISKMDIVDTFI